MGIVRRIKFTGVLLLVVTTAFSQGEEKPKIFLEAGGYASYRISDVGFYHQAKSPNYRDRPAFGCKMYTGIIKPTSFGTISVGFGFMSMKLASTDSNTQSAYNQWIYREKDIWQYVQFPIQTSFSLNDKWNLSCEATPSYMINYVKWSYLTQNRKQRPINSEIGKVLVDYDREGVSRFNIMCAVGISRAIRPNVILGFKVGASAFDVTGGRTTTLRHIYSGFDLGYVLHKAN